MVTNNFDFLKAKLRAQTIKNCFSSQDVICPGLWRPLVKISWCHGMHFMLGANLSAHLLKSIWAGLHQRKCRGPSGHVWTTWNGPSMKVKIWFFSESCLAAFSGWHDLILYTGLIYLRGLHQCLLWPEKFRWPCQIIPVKCFGGKTCNI